ncbi:oxidase [Mycolicibacterium chubuense]|uniref:Copper resistance protein A n=1 Tax=Mycolicibacterium chubuense TaxID=1800 RepID=A0A0J6YK72_MYCCU|nr:multicopper oxidase family protein [Mycolicibacterium chubuense]KMO73221.1 Copper resistance protein A precursor [Mycolicibacterium chubuense]ORA56766.1 oxidase [Mycolicibacterium chubuense]SPX98757.1 putative multicopper oxidase [Mycolicibacterium chubuense]
MALSRRSFLAAAAAGAALSACARPTAPPAPRQPAAGLTEAIARTEAARPHTGRTVTAHLRAGSSDLDLGGPVVRSLAYDGRVAGPVVRGNVGDELAVTVTNGLDHPTSVHWHGIALRNDMDGAAPATPEIAPGADFTYRFTSPVPGTYWAHPHAGLDTDYGLYLPVIVDDPAEPGDYDAEWIVVLDDWTAGVGPDPHQILDGLRSRGMSMHGMGGAASPLLAGDGGDVSYPYYLVNGRIPSAATGFTARAGQRLRIRFINAAADTAFRVALAGHPMTVTHTDGYPVEPVDVDAVLLGMGERYDVLVTAADGVFPLVAVAEGKNGAARALLRTRVGSDPGPDFRPAELAGRVATAAALSAAAPVRLAPAPPDAQLQAVLSGGMMGYDWRINGRPFTDAVPLTVAESQRAVLHFVNRSMMWHPMHLHGHTFEVLRSDGAPGPRKDTVIVAPMTSVAVAFDADNPGVWMLHCHNGYHMDAGMMTTLEYV